MQICSIAWIKVLNIIYKEDTSQSLYTNTLHLFTCLHVMINIDVKQNEMQTWCQQRTKSLKRCPPQLLLLYRKIPKKGPGACIFQGPLLRGLSTKGYLRFKIDWASLIVGSKFTVLALFYFVFEGNFPRTSPRGAYIWRGDLTEGFLRHRFGGLIFGGAYTWRGLFSEFYGT